MLNNRLKRYSIPLIIRKHIKTTVKCHFISIRISKIKKIKSFFYENVEQLKLSYTA